MRNSWYKKGIVFVIIVIFIGAGISLVSADKTVSVVDELNNQVDEYSDCFIIGKPRGDVASPNPYGWQKDYNFGGPFYGYYIIDKSPLRVIRVFKEVGEPDPITHVQGFTGFFFTLRYFYPYYSFIIFGSVDHIMVNWQKS